MGSVQEILFGVGRGGLETSRVVRYNGTRRPVQRLACTCNGLTGSMVIVHASQSKRSSVHQAKQNSYKGSNGGGSPAAEPFDQTTGGVDSRYFADAADYETDYSVQWKLGVEPLVMYWMIGGAAGFLVLFAVAIGLHAADVDADDAAIVDSGFPFGVPASIFGVLLALDLLSLMFPALSRPPILITLASTLVRSGATLSYLAQALEWAPNLVMREGSWLVPIRYIDWLVTTPALIALLGSLVEAPVQVLRTTVIADVVMIILGILARPSPPAARWILFVLSCLAFVVAMWGCALMLQDAHARALNEASRRRVWAVSIVVGLLLCVYPLMFILEAEQAIDAFERDVFFSVADIGVKIGVTSVLSRMSILRFSEELDMSAAVLQHMAREKARLLGAVRNRVDPSLGQQLSGIEELRRVLVAQKSQDAAAASSSHTTVGQSSGSRPDQGAGMRRRAAPSKLLGDKDVGGSAAIVPISTGSFQHPSDRARDSSTALASSFMDPIEAIDNVYSLALGMSKAMNDVAMYEQATSGTLKARIAPLNPVALYRPIRARVRGLALRKNIKTEFLWLDSDGFVDDVGALVDMRALYFVLLTTVHSAVQSAGRNGSVLVLCEVLPHHRRSAYRGSAWHGSSEDASGGAQGHHAYFLRVLVCDSGAKSVDLDPAVRARKSEQQTQLMVDQKNRVVADSAAMFRSQARQEADQERQTFAMYSRGVGAELSPAEAIAAVHPERPVDGRMTVRELMALGQAQDSVADRGRAASAMELGLCRFLVERMRGAVRLLPDVESEVVDTAREAGRQGGWNLPGQWKNSMRDSIHGSEMGDSVGSTNTTDFELSEQRSAVQAAVPPPAMRLEREKPGEGDGDSSSDEQAGTPVEKATSQAMVNIAPQSRGSPSGSGGAGKKIKVLENERGGSKNQGRGGPRRGGGGRSGASGPATAGAGSGGQDDGEEHVVPEELKYVLEMVLPLHTVSGIAQLARDETKLRAFLGEHGASQILPQLGRSPGGVFSIGSSAL